MNGLSIATIFSKKKWKNVYYNIRKFLDKQFMDNFIAEQIAQLINKNNKLVNEYSAIDILNKKKNYIYELLDGKVIGTIRIKKIQWYQAELLHLSVKEEHRGKGLAYRLIQQGEKLAKEKGAKIIQCTIREENIGSIKLFQKLNYIDALTFFYDLTKNKVHIFQKTL